MAPIQSTLDALADEYGVETPEGGEGLPVTLYRDDQGWHVSSDWPGLTDADWAPRDDAHADWLRKALDRRAEPD